MIGVSAVAKTWTIELNDRESLLHCLKGRCASVLNISDLEKLSTQRGTNEMVDAESNVLTFSAECFYFSTDDIIVDVSVPKTDMHRVWEEYATAEGVSLRESPSCVNFSSSSPMKHPGHYCFGFCPIDLFFSCLISSASFRSFIALSVLFIY